jgi:hypothetical protein
MRKITPYLLLIVCAACKQKYELPYSGPSAGYLVVDGMINSGQGPTNIRISRTLALVDTIIFRNETEAAVWVQGENNTEFALQNAGEGLYTSAQLNLQPDVKYRLRIETPGGKIYYSEFIQNKYTPDIDSVSWEKDERGVIIFANTHDDQNNTWYYRWDYEDAWEFNSAYYSSLKYVYDSDNRPIDVTDRPYAESIGMYTCWKETRSSDILIGSSRKLSRDFIHLPILSIEDGSWKLSVLYSILLRQHAVTAANFEFLQRMKKNTEQVGTLFDAQPSELIGNIHCEGDPSEIVIGYVDVSELKEKRVFIRNSDVQPWNFQTGCSFEVLVNHPDSINATLVPMGWIDAVYFTASSVYCTDCTIRGSNVKPSFWP